MHACQWRQLSIHVGNEARSLNIVACATVGELKRQLEQRHVFDSSRQELRVWDAVGEGFAAEPDGEPLPTGELRVLVQANFAAGRRSFPERRLYTPQQRTLTPGGPSTEVVQEHSSRFGTPTTPGVPRMVIPPPTPPSATTPPDPQFEQENRQPQIDARRLAEAQSLARGRRPMGVHAISPLHPHPYVLPRALPGAAHPTRVTTSSGNPAALAVSVDGFLQPASGVRDYPLPTVRLTAAATNRQTNWHRQALTELVNLM
tara:strand:+ start:158 stop:934 length:777 start_codon:yes stop_codon:yes gene_type:complete